MKYFEIFLPNGLFNIQSESGYPCLNALAFLKSAPEQVPALIHIVRKIFSHLQSDICMTASITFDEARKVYILEILQDISYKKALTNTEY